MSFQINIKMKRGQVKAYDSIVDINEVHSDENRLIIIILIENLTERITHCS